MAEPPTDNMTASQQPSVLKRLSDKLGLKLNLPTLLLMFKGAVAPTIGLAIYQAKSVSDHYSTVGYLIPIMSLFVVPVLPRARFLQNFFVTCILTCFAAAISLLYMWTAIKARQNTTPISAEERSNGPVPGAQVVPYSAAASACIAVWFFFWLWAYNTFRAFRPQYFLPLIVFGIFINVTAVYGAIFPEMEQVYSLIKRLLDTFFVGFGLAFAVHFVVLPITCMDLGTLVLNEYLHVLKTVIDAKAALLISVPTRDWNNAIKTSSAASDSEAGEPTERLVNWPEADEWRALTAAATECQIKLQSEMRYIKREITFSKLSGKDYSYIAKLLKNILIPISGLETVIQANDRIEKQGGWVSVKTDEDGSRFKVSDQSFSNEERESWSVLFSEVNPAFNVLWQAMIEGLDYGFHTLQITKKPAFTTKAALEARATDSPEGKGFAQYLERTINHFLVERKGPLKQWCTQNGLDETQIENKSAHQRHTSKLYLLLDLEYCVVTTAAGILDLVRYADSKVEDGTMKKKRLIVPSWKTFKKWAWAVVLREDSNLDYTAYSYRSGSPTVYLGDAFGVYRDPEHLSPETWWEKTTDYFRLIPRLFGSKESWFGFKVATGTMVIAISAFLRNSQLFYIKQRIIWGAIMVSISMTQTAGSGMYGQFLRIFGTFLAMVISYIDWYIVDGHTAGVIVFVALTMFLYHYLMIAKPSDPVLPMIGMITVILVVAYELQVKQVGVALSESNGQIFHPVYELAPYRMACVLAGVGVACLFTYFPSVTTARSEMRKDLGNTLFLLGQFYSSSHKAVSLRLQGLEGDIHDKNSSIRKLETARNQLFAKELILIQAMQNHLKFIKWEPTFGGRFPKEVYERLLAHTQNILRFTAMIAWTTKTFKELPTSGHGITSPNALTDTSASDGTWLKDFTHLVSSLELTSHSVTSMLAIFSGAIGTGKPLPPYLKAPARFHISEMLSSLDSHILSTKNVCEPGYSAFAVIQVSTTMLSEDLADLLAETKKLVGEAEFNLDVVQEDYEKNVGSVPREIREKKD